MPLILNAHTFPGSEFRLTTITDQNTNMRVNLCQHAASTDELTCQSVMKNSVTVPSLQPAQTIVSVHIPRRLLQGADYIYAEISNIPKDGFLKAQFYNMTQQLYIRNISMMSKFTYSISTV
jgi:hypothetical protein